MAVKGFVVELDWFFFGLAQFNCLVCITGAGSLAVVFSLPVRIGKLCHMQDFQAGYIAVTRVKTEDLRSRKCALIGSVVTIVLLFFFLCDIRNL